MSKPKNQQIKGRRKTKGQKNVNIYFEPFIICPTSDGIEDTEHFLLLYPSFDLQSRDLLTAIVDLLRQFVQIANLSNDALVQLLLYGDQDLSL